MAWTQRRKDRAMEAANELIRAAKKTTRLSLIRRFGRGAVKDIRTVLSGSPYNLTCAPAGYRKPFAYWITAVREEDANRRRTSLRYTLSKFSTELDMNQSFILATRGNTTEGKVARAFKAALDSAVAQLELIT